MNVGDCSLITKLVLNHVISNYMGQKTNKMEERVWYLQV